MFADYPFHAEILHALQTASVRPGTPDYQVLSIDISHLVSPPASINPVSTEQGMTGEIRDALQQKGLIASRLAVCSGPAARKGSAR